MTSCCEALSNTSVHLLQYGSTTMGKAALQAMLQDPQQKRSKQYESFQ